MVISVDDAKAHMNITSDSEDALIEGLIASAEAHFAAQLGFDIEEDAPADLLHGIKMLVAHWYENREATLVGVTAQPVPLGVRDILFEHRNWSWGE